MKTIIVAIALCLATLAGTAIAQDHDHGYRLSCYSAEQWRGNDLNRPCDVIGTPKANGSNYVVQETASRKVGICYLPDPDTKHGDYVVRCHKIEPAELLPEEGQGP